ncbi:Protein-L-isoaspartate O-methyltransferase [bacterium HR17]|uniref:Protein-L-isoaspartate O-methyltransferase n=1 Tax=Candidatus Fervidibacter japonicus TaxID=2035412 RepID=A0A2H5XCD1_9BACT|nr:Protein-L-isoaspartate O-methyltransferase [bacterium HR17]
MERWFAARWDNGKPPKDVETRLAQLRAAMVEHQLRRRGIRDERVLSAFLKVPRHRFVRPQDRWQAYEDHPLPIGYGQTISQPYIVALMTELLELRGDERVLEIGTGSGYQAAILAELAREVITVERIPELAHRAQQVLAELGYTNVTVVVGDGSLGVPEHAPFDAIVVTAAAPHPPKPLLHQLKDGGRLVIPIGDRHIQELVRFVRRGDEWQQERYGPCLFVPLIGKESWRGSDSEGGLETL